MNLQVEQVAGFSFDDNLFVHLLLAASWYRYVNLQVGKNTFYRFYWLMFCRVSLQLPVAVHLQQRAHFLALLLLALQLESIQLSFEGQEQFPAIWIEASTEMKVFGFIARISHARESNTFRLPAHLLLGDTSAWTCKLNKLRGSHSMTTFLYTCF